jgi:hypothetical protein
MQRESLALGIRLNEDDPRPMDVPGQAIESADYVLIAEIVNIEHWQQQAERRVQGLADDLEHLVSSRRMLVLERVL